MPEEEEVCKADPETIKKALEMLCRGETVEIPGGVMVNASPPDEVLEKRDDESLSCEERIEAVAESEWAINEAKGLATELFGIEPETPGYKDAVKKAAIRIAQGAVPQCASVSIDPGKIDL